MGKWQDPTVGEMSLKMDQTAACLVESQQILKLQKH